MTKKSEKIQLFLEAALKNFIENGIYETKVKDIAKESGITERTAFRYFDSKMTMVLEALRLLWKRYLEKVNSSFHNLDLAHSSTKEKLKAILMLYGNIYLTDKKQLLFVEEAESYLTRNNVNVYVNQEFPINTSSKLNPLAETIKEGIKKGDIKSSNKIELLYYNSFEALLGFMQKLSVEFYNKRITDELAETKLEAFTDILVEAFLK